LSRGYCLASRIPHLFLLRRTQATGKEKQAMAQHRRRKESAQKHTDRYRSFFENALEGLFRSTPQGRFTEVNPALVRILGYSSAEEVLALKLPDDLYVGNRSEGGKLSGKEWWRSQG
jgi:PAS domain-containing protein